MRFKVVANFGQHFLIDPLSGLIYTPMDNYIKSLEQKRCISSTIEELYEVDILNKRFMLVSLRLSKGEREREVQRCNR